MAKKSDSDFYTGTSLSDLLGKKVPDLDTLGRLERLQEMEREKQALLTKISSLEKEIQGLKAHDAAEKTSTDGRPAPDTIDEIFKKAVTEMKQDNFIDAMGLLQAVLFFNPSHIKAQLNLAVVYHGLGFIDRAVKTLEIILEQDPENDHCPWENLAIINQG